MPESPPSGSAHFFGLLLSGIASLHRRHTIHAFFLQFVFAFFYLQKSHLSFFPESPLCPLVVAVVMQFTHFYPNQITNLFWATSSPCAMHIVRIIFKTINDHCIESRDSDVWVNRATCDEVRQLDFQPSTFWSNDPRCATIHKDTLYMYIQSSSFISGFMPLGPCNTKSG